jgi:hypothetical protein
VDVSFDLTGAAYATPTDTDTSELRSVLEAQLLPNVDSDAVIKNLVVSSSISASSSSSSSSSSSLELNVVKGARELVTYTWTVSFSVK